MNIAIMGATSHIAKGLIVCFLNCEQDYLHLFSRSVGNVRRFLTEARCESKNAFTLHSGYDGFLSHSYDLIINCVGVETRNMHNCDFTRYFGVTEEFDNLAIRYLKNINNEALYVSFSSGAVYGKGFSVPAADDSVNSISVNHMVPEDFYGIARINAEAKHRSHSNLRIIDLRVFSYFSRYINLTDGFFITDVIQAVLENKALLTDANNIVRDYLHMEDLFAMIKKCAAADKLNGAFDVNSLKPVSKQEILDYFSSTYALQYEKQPFAANISATGAKSNYFSISRKSGQIGFTPKYSSMDTIKLETGFILSQNKIMRKDKQL